MGYFYDKMATTMKIYGLAERTQKRYLDEMKKYIGYFNISPDKLNEKHIYIYQSYLVNQKKIGYSSFRIMVNALRFFYNKIMHYDWLIKYIPYQKKRLNYQPY